MNLENIVIDTNVFISAVLNPQGTPRKVIDLGLKKFQIIQSDSTYQELTTRINKKKFDRYISIDDRRGFLESLKKNTKFISVQHQTKICADADDNKFIELAVSGEAKYLITGDDDLLILEAYQGIQIVRPAEFWALHN